METMVNQDISPQDHLLTLSDVSYTYYTKNGSTTALNHITFSVKDGEFLAIVGPSGCGKSTLLNIIAGLLPPTTGQISNHIPIGYMLQKDHLLEWRTIYKNITLGLEIQRRISKEHLEHIDQLLKDYGLYEFKNAYPRELSGGMRQRVALIRTLALSPKLLLLDEPFSALDYQTRLNVADDIGSIIKKQKMTAILVTHDLAEAISMADRIIILSKRPASIKKEIPIYLTMDNEISPTKARNSKEFPNYFHQIWEEINDETTSIS